MDPVKKLLIRHRSKIIIAMSIVLLFLALCNVLVITTVNPTSNDECLWVRVSPGDSAALRFESVKVGGVTWNAGIRDGDYLIAINASKFNTDIQAQMILNKVKGGDYATYTVKKKSGEIIETKVYIKKLINFTSLGVALLGFFWLLIAFIVLIAKPDGKVQRLFYAVGATLVLLMVYNLQSLPFVMSFTPLAFFLELLNTGGIIYAPALIILFFLVFPHEYKFVRNKVVNLIFYILPAVILIGTIVYRFIYVYGSSGGPRYYEQFIIIGNIFLRSAFIVGFVFLLVSYFRLKTRDERKPLFIILVSYLLAILVVLYTLFIAPAISDLIFNSPEFYMPIIILFILPIAFGYSIFRYQLMDVSVVVKNTIVYGAATISIAAVYFLVIYVIGQTVSMAIGTEYKGIIAGIIFITFALVFQSTKDKFQDFLTSKFYPEQFAYQKILIGFSNDITTVVGLENILGTMISTFVESLKIKKFGVMLYNEQQKDFYLVKSVGLNSEELRFPSINLKKIVSEKTAISKSTVIEEDEFTHAFPVNRAQIKENGIYTIIPMIIKQKVIGLMLLGLKHSGAKFAGKDLDLLNAVANQSAVAIENARLYKTEAEKIKIEMDLDLARKIQQGLLPKAIPEVKGLDISGEMIPAMQVGGDYFDLIPVDEDRLFVVVADVSGKGLSAALYMTKLQTMIELACKNDKQPAEILIDINKKIYNSLERNWFITMTVALFDMKQNKVHFCRAGHMPVFEVQDGTISKYRTVGLGIGLEKGIIFEKTLCEEEVALNKNQVFAFFSDGVTEAMNEQNDLFGEENLSGLLKNKSSYCSEEILKEVWQNIQAFRGKAEVNDDMTMVVVKVQE